MGIGSPIWSIEGVALNSTGDEVADSLGVVVKAIQSTQTSDSADITAIKAVTDVIPDAGAMTSIAQESTLEDVEEEVEEIDHHEHNVERWWGTTGADTETNAIAATLTPYSATSGNNTWGGAVPICGTADTPAHTGATHFDPHRLEIVSLDDETDPWRFRMIYGTGTSGEAITAGQWSEIIVASNAVPGNRAGGSPVSIRMPVLTVGTKLWAQCWNNTNAEVMQFFWGAHGYPGKAGV